MFPTFTLHEDKDLCKYCHDFPQKDPTKLKEHEDFCRIVHNRKPSGEPIRVLNTKKASKSDGVIRTTGGDKSDPYDVEAMAALVESVGSEKNGKKNKKKAADIGGSDVEEKKECVEVKNTVVDEAAGNSGGSTEEKNAVVVDEAAGKSGGSKEEKKKRIREKKKKKKEEKKKELAAVTEKEEEGGEEKEEEGGEEKEEEGVNDSGSEKEDVKPELVISKTELIARFANITCLSIKESYMILSSHNFNFDDAVSAFYDQTTTAESQKITSLSEIILPSENSLLIISFAEITSLSVIESYNLVSSHNFNIEDALSAFCATASEDVAAAARQKQLELRDEARVNLAREVEREYYFVRRGEELDAREMALDLKARELEARQKTEEENVAVENGSDSPAPSSPSSSSSSSSSSSISPPPSFEYKTDEAARKKFDAGVDEEQHREWDVGVRHFEIMAREEALGERERLVVAREERVVARENRAVEYKEKLKIFEANVIKQKEDAVKINEALTEERHRMVSMELAIRSREAAHANDWTRMEKAMIQRWKNAKALEEELLDVEKKLLIREEAVMKSEGKKNNYDE